MIEGRSPMKNKHQSGQGDRQFDVRPRRVRHPQHDELVDADPEVVDIFDQLQTEYRHERINHLIAASRRDYIMQRHRDRERRILVTRLFDFLNNRFERMD